MYHICRRTWHDGTVGCKWDQIPLPPRQSLSSRFFKFVMRSNIIHEDRPVNVAHAGGQPSSMHASSSEGLNFHRRRAATLEMDRTGTSACRPIRRQSFNRVWKCWQQQITPCASSSDNYLFVRVFFSWSQVWPSHDFASQPARPCSSPFR